MSAEVARSAAYEHEYTLSRSCQLPRDAMPLGMYRVREGRQHEAERRGFRSPEIGRGVQKPEACEKYREQRAGAQAGLSSPCLSAWPFSFCLCPPIFGANLQRKATCLLLRTVRLGRYVMRHGRQGMLPARQGG